MEHLVITADDYGYSPRYDAGIVEAAAAEAVDSVSALVGGDLDPGPLLATGVEIGLHLELGDVAEDASRGAPAGEAEREAALEALEDQLASFESAFGGAPAHLDGHHHCHARPGLAAAIGRAAAARGLPVRSVDPRHRRLLRCFGVPTPDRLVGRIRPTDAAVPELISDVVAGEGEGEWPSGVTEWLTHPGHRDPERGSRYDTEREEDLRLLLELADEPALRRHRGTHAETLTT